ncbi:unnamed protein product, partial [marine sediment metagenome]
VCEGVAKRTLCVQHSETANPLIGEVPSVQAYQGL